MDILYTTQFARDIKGLKDKSVVADIEEAIAEVKNASLLSDISKLKKLQGSKHAYRIRIGDYRIGLLSMVILLNFAVV